MLSNRSPIAKSPHTEVQSCMCVCMYTHVVFKFYVYIVMLPGALNFEEKSYVMKNNTINSSGAVVSID